MFDSIYRYGNDYPDQCPPSEASSPIGISLYRICKSESGSTKLLSDDFVPVWENQRRKFPKNKECGAKALSFNSSLNDLSSLMQDHPNIGKRIVKVNLNESCGVIKQTSANHYNLWDLFNPGIIDAIGNEWEEVI
ncbi:hypothetical protein LIZ91_02695 [Enterococcus avium]|uniref:hypothetical protein n=1 Tax=Enterococcus avium TaxID=33945 RepID=UPI001D07D0F2|nr:hypothetical protein [Enterococcus avium]MCB6915485.1 hypothetical protein [Enterococcus avium]MCQ4960414.1 hypothetical protein [Enterococcus avium]